MRVDVTVNPYSRQVHRMEDNGGGRLATVRVIPVRSFVDLAPLRGEIDALNLASPRPCPFATYEYLQAFLEHDEYARADDEMLFLAALCGDRLIGYLPLRRRRERLLGIPFVRIGVLLDHDTDRPHVVARGEDEARCCRAFYEYLLEEEPGWSFLEFAFQDRDSGLSAVPLLAPSRFHVRRFETMPNTTLALPYRSLAEYFASLSKNHRRNVARRCRQLLGAGRVSVFSCQDARATPPLLDLYLDLERRSWKKAAHAGVSRDPRRVAFFRSLAEPGQPLTIGFDFVLVDDLPVSALLHGAFGSTLYGLETAFDSEYEDLGPGHLLQLMTIRRAVALGYGSVNYDGNYAYYKSRWGGTVTETSAVQIYRVWSLPHLKARVGELRRRLAARLPGARTDDTQFNPERRRVAATPLPGDEQGRIPARRAARPLERELARATMREVERRGARLERLGPAEIASALPFDLARGAA